jgi:predicted hotdog family 3-hydroxylacyl-ACP dehydratase
MTAARRSAADFVPHRPPMLWLDEVGEETPSSVVCYTTIRPDFIFLDGPDGLDDGHVRPVVMIELVAQASAVHLGLKARRAGRPPRFGMLVGCREAEFFVERLEVGDELTVTVERAFDEPEVSAFVGTVARGGAVIGRVSLSVVNGDPTHGDNAP